MIRPTVTVLVWDDVPPGAQREKMLSIGDSSSSGSILRPPNRVDGWTPQILHPRVPNGATLPHDALLEVR
jgi:hypothetical protein